MRRIILSNSDIFTIIALVLNMITLFIVVYQTMVTRGAFELAKSSFDEDKNIRKFTLLPKANFIIHVDMKIDTWINELNRLDDVIEVALKDENIESLIIEAEKYNSSPSGMVRKYYYDNSPNWLAEIYITAARHYYYVTGPFSNIKDHNLAKKIAVDIQGRIQESLNRIGELKGYISDIVPESYLSAPTSLRDDAFMD